MTTDDRRRRNARILVIVAGALVVVVGAVGVLLLTAGGSGGTDDPNKAAQSFVDVYQRGLNSAGRDVQASDFAPFVCAADMDGIKEAFSAKENPTAGEPQFKMSVKDVKVDGDKGTFTVTSQITATGAQQTSDDESYSLVKENGTWRVCGLGA